MSNAATEKLRKLFSRCSPEMDMFHLDDIHGVLTGACALEETTGDLHAALGDLERVARESTTEVEVRAALREAGYDWGFYDGESQRSFCDWVIDNVVRLEAAGQLLPRDFSANLDEAFPRRKAEFYSEEHAVRARVAAEEAISVEELAASGHDQYHVLVAVGQPVGTFYEDVVGSTIYEAQHVSVVLTRHGVTGRIAVASIAPDDAFDVNVRWSFPDLVHLFGGHFGAAIYDDVSPLQEQNFFMIYAEEPAFSNVRVQLDALLEKSDADLRYAVNALGSWVQPEPDWILRGWIERMRRRMDYFDWNAVRAALEHPLPPR